MKNIFSDIIMGRAARRRIALLTALALLLCVPVWADEADFEILAPADDMTAGEPNAGFEALPVEDPVPEADDSQLLPPDEAQQTAVSAATDEGVEGTAGEAAGDVDKTEEKAAAEEPEDEDGSPALERSSLSLGVKEKARLTLTDGVLPKSIGAVFTSSNSRVVAVNSATGEVTAKKTGSATVTMKAGDVTSTCEITVKKAPSKLSVSPSKLTMGVGEERVLSVTLPKNTASAISFYTSDSRVARVDYEGHIIAVKKGNAIITARTFNGKKATCKITVVAAPKSISLKPAELSLWLGDTYTLKPTLSKNSGGSYTVAVSEGGVLSASGNKLKALQEGAATVTVTTYNGLSAQMSVQVARKPVYRALLIGESNFPGTDLKPLPGKKDVALMSNMLKSVKGPAGTKWQIATRLNRTASQILSDITEAFSGAQEGDVSLFYISSHGDMDLYIDADDGEYAGSLRAYPDYDYDSWEDRYTLTLPRLAQALAEVPGRVIVLLDSCGSGAAIYTPKGGSAPVDYTPERYDQAVVDAFEAADRAIMAPGLEQGAFIVENKFYVMTSTAYQETGWSMDENYSYFTKWVTDGIGTSGKMPADANRNSFTTLYELFDYVSDRAGRNAVRSKGILHVQHVQVYPANCQLELFYRK